MPAPGLLARSFVFLPGEDPAAFAAEYEALVADWGPRSTTQQYLVEQMVIQRWRLMRAQALEARLQQDKSTADASADDEARARRLAAFGRYIRGIEQSLRQAMLDLERIMNMQIRAGQLEIERGLLHEVAARRREPIPAAEPPPPPRAPDRLPSPPAAITPANRAERRRQEALARQQQRRAA